MLSKNHGVHNLRIAGTNKAMQGDDYNMIAKQV